MIRARTLIASLCAADPRRRVMRGLTLVTLLSAGCADDAPARERPLDATLAPSAPEASVDAGAPTDAASADVASADAASALDASSVTPNDASSVTPSDASASPAADAGRDASTVPAPDASAGDASLAPDAGDATASSGMFSLTSSVVKNGEMLPAKHRCMSGGGTGPSFPLAWSGAPSNTQSFAVLMRDRTFMNYQHWTLYDIPATTSSLPEGVPAGASTMPAGAKQANNSRGLTGPGYFGPCGMSGVNTYELTLYALGVATLPNAGTTGTSVEAALAAHILAMTSLSVRSGP